MANYYINRFNRKERWACSSAPNRYKTTIYQTTSKEEATFLVREHTLKDPESVYYVTSKPCKGWEVSQ